MPKFPMDLSKFEKISASDKKTTLKHKDGHFIVIAHSKLGPDIRKGLDALPFAKGGKVTRQSNPKLSASKQTLADGGEVAEPDPQKAKEMQTGATQSGWQPRQWAKNLKEGLGMADGGEVQSTDRQPTSNNPTSDGKAPSHVVGPPKPKRPTADEATNPQDFMNRAHQEFVEQYGGGTQLAKGGKIERSRALAEGGEPSEAPLEVEKIEDTPTAAIRQPTPDAPQAAPAQAAPVTEPEAAQTEQPAPASDDQPPKAQDVGKEGMVGPTIPEQILNERNATAQDMMTGQVHPKTYQDLFNEKSTLGKIGTAFGLLVGGMGSGLTHQPNIIYQMMDKMIDRDLDAQKTSAANRQNFFKIRQQQQVNDALVKHYAATNKVSEAQARNELAQAGLSELKLKMANDLLGSPAQDLHTSTLSKMDMQTAAIHQLDQQNQKLPPGPTKQAADTALAGYAQHVFQQEHPKMAQQVGDAYAAEQQGGPPLTTSRRGATAGATPEAAPPQQSPDDPNLQPGSSVAPSTPPPPQVKIDYGKLRKHATAGEMGIPGFPTPGESASMNKSADQIESTNIALREIHKAMGDMWKNADGVDALTNALGNQHIFGLHLPLEKITSSISGIPAAKRYWTAASTVKKNLANVIKGGGSEELYQLIGDQLPNKNDTPDDYRQKLQNINNILMQGLDTGVFRKYPGLVTGLPQ